MIVGGAFSDGGSIGLYAAGFARALGAEDVVFCSQDPGLRSRAEADGATAVDAGNGYPAIGLFDVTVDASGIPEGLTYALKSTGPGGVCTCTAAAVHRGSPIPFPVYEMYMRAVTFRTGWVHTRSLIDEPLQIVAAATSTPQQSPKSTRSTTRRRCWRSHSPN